MHPLALQSVWCVLDRNRKVGGWTVGSPQDGNLAPKGHSVQYFPVVNVIAFTTCLGEVRSSPISDVAQLCLGGWRASPSWGRRSANASKAHVPRDRKAQLGTEKRGLQLARLIVGPVRRAPQRMNEALYHDLPAVAAHREREAGDRCQTVDRLVGDALHLELCDRGWHDRHADLG